MKFTYRVLKAILDKLTEEQLYMNVTAYTEDDLSKDEFYQCLKVYEHVGDGVLDNGHPYIAVK